MNNQSPSEYIRFVVSRVSDEVKTVIYGHEQVTELITGAFLIGGHVLLEGPPGVAKTLLARTFAKSIGLEFSRIQFTPDLMPSDVTGVYVFDQNSAAFRFARGPIFAPIVLADEINRAVPKTQSALLEAMEEHFVTIDSIRHPLDELFFLVATQNPIEHEGTFPLPEAQLDRFLFKVNMGYPDSSQEIEMIQRFSRETPLFELSRHECSQHLVPDDSHDVQNTNAVNRDMIILARRAVRDIVLDESVAAYIHKLALATRNHRELIIGASPRAAMNLALAAKLHAALDGRDYAIPDDVKAMSVSVLSHRLVFQPEIYDSRGRADELVQEVIESVPMSSPTIK